MRRLFLLILATTLSGCSTSTWKANPPSIPYPVPRPPAPIARAFPPEVGQLHIEGRTFRRADGSVWDWRGATMFLLPCRFFRGEDILPEIRWMQRHGVNVARVFIAGVSGPGWLWAEWVPECRRPWERYGWDGFAGKAHEFNVVLAREGLRVENTVVTDDDVDVDTYAQVLDTVYQAVAGLDPGMFVEWVNEPWVAGRQQLLEALMRRGIDRRGVLSAYGMEPGRDPNRPEGFWVEVPTLDYFTVHSPRDYEHFVQNPKELSEQTSLIPKPVVDDEPLGVADFERQGGGARLNNLDWHLQHQATCRLFAAGCTVHSQFGLEGRKPNADEPISEAIVAAISAMWRFIPGDAYAAPYPADTAAPHLGRFPLAWSDADSEVHHAYAKPSGAYLYAVNLRPPASWEPAGANGWTVEQTFDGFKYIVRLRQ